MASRPKKPVSEMRALPGFCSTFRPLTSTYPFKGLKAASENLHLFGCVENKTPISLIHPGKAIAESLGHDNGEPGPGIAIGFDRNIGKSPQTIGGQIETAYSAQVQDLVVVNVFGLVFDFLLILNEGRNEFMIVSFTCPHCADQSVAGIYGVLHRHGSPSACRRGVPGRGGI